jgi:predicted permease
MTRIIAVLFAVMAFGWFFRRLNLVREGSDKVFSRYLYYLALPALIIVTLSDTPMTGLSLRFAALNAAPLLSAMALVWLLWKTGVLKWRFARMLAIVSVLGNTAYFGFPVVSLRFGAQAVGAAAVAASLQNVIVFTFGFAVMTLISEEPCPAGRFFRLLARNVVLWASLAGLAMAGFGLGLPGPLHDILAGLGGTTLPLALFTLGVSLYGKRVTGNLARIGAAGALKLLFVPAAYLVFAAALGYKGEFSRVAFLQTAMPPAVLNFVIAEEFGFDAELVGQVIVFSTLVFFPLLYLYDFALKALL